MSKNLTVFKFFQTFMPRITALAIIPLVVTATTVSAHSNDQIHSEAKVSHLKSSSIPNRYSDSAIDKVWGRSSEFKSPLMSAPISHSLEEIISLIQAVEKAYPDDDWKVIAARLRKTHYNSKLWDLLLVGSIATKPASTEHGVSHSVINTLRKGNILFEDPRGNAIDVTHIWALINALAFPDIDTAIDDLSGISVADAISWVGDVGSVVSEYGLKTRPQFGTLTEYFDGYAAGSDLYGDIDGYGIYFQEVEGDLSLSERIKHYYQGNYKKRFAYYSQATSIKIVDGGDDFIISELSLRKIVAPHIKKFAFFWTLHLCKLNKLECAIEEIEGKIYTQKDIKSVVSLYSQWVSKQLTQGAP